MNLKNYYPLKENIFLLFILLATIVVFSLKCQKERTEYTTDSGQGLESYDDQTIKDLHSGVIRGKKNVSEILFGKSNFGLVENKDKNRATSLSVDGQFFGEDGKYLKTDFIIGLDTIEKNLAVNDEEVYGFYYTYSYPNASGPNIRLENYIYNNNIDIVISNSKLGSYHFTHKPIREILLLNNLSKTINKKQPLVIRWVELGNNVILTTTRTTISSYDTLTPTPVEGEKVYVGVGVDPTYNNPTNSTYNAIDYGVYKEVENNGATVFSPAELNKLDNNTDATSIIIIKGKESSFPATEKDNVNISELSTSRIAGYSIEE